MIRDTPGGTPAPCHRLRGWFDPETSNHLLKLRGDVTVPIGVAMAA
jgi:hypothetical protein